MSWNPLRICCALLLGIITAFNLQPFQAFCFGASPNIVFFLTDDQDVILNGLESMNQTKKLLYNEGLNFQNAFVSSPVCCVSRASFLAGRYVHNTYTFNNSYTGGCQNNETWNDNVEKDTYAVHVQKAGYRTLYAGKYLNGYGLPCCGGLEHVPPGWTEWYTLQGNSRYYNYKVSDNGQTLEFGDNYTTDYFTDNIKRRGLKFLENQDASQPFMIVLATPAAHDPFTPAPQYNETDAGEQAPRTPNWNLVGQSNKHQLMRLVPPMNATKIQQSDAIYRYRHGTLRSVDDMVAAIYDKVQDMGVLDNTYFVFTSDHGFHLGQFGMHFDKRQMYETDLRIPFVVKGPGVPAGTTTDFIVTNVDIAPTFVDIATGDVPASFDGLSFKSVLTDKNWFVAKDSLQSERAQNTDSQFYVEYYGEEHPNSVQNGVIQHCSCAIPDYLSAICDQFNNTYQCVRSISADQVKGEIYCSFICYDQSRNVVTCPADLPEGQGEYYDLDKDPWQLNNTWDELSENQIKQFETAIMNFGNCKGQSECNGLRFGKDVRKHGFVPVKDEPMKLLSPTVKSRLGY